MKSLNRIAPCNGICALRADFFAGIAVFLTAIPLCLGIALASGAPVMSGIISGIIGGVVVGFLSNSHTSISGPAAGNIAVMLAASESLGGFRGVLLAIMLAGVIQIMLSFVNFGKIMHYIPSSVTLGLLGAIGIIIIVKQTPYLLGHSALPPERIMSLSEHGMHEVLLSLGTFLREKDWGVTMIGAMSIALMFLWPKYAHKIYKRLRAVPAPVVVVVTGTVVVMLLQKFCGYNLDRSVFINIPTWYSIADISFKDVFIWPIYQDITNPQVYLTGITISIIASIETLLNIGATDRLDPARRHTNANREMFAQGVGNLLCGMLGALPVTSVIMRSTVGINSGAKTKMSTIFHGLLLLVCVALLPDVLNRMPLTCLAGILIATGYKLIHVTMLKEVYRRGMDQFLPFIVTVIAIIATDLLIGVVIGIITALCFALKDQHDGIVVSKEGYDAGEVLRIELPTHISFLKQHALSKCLKSIPAKSTAFIDARYVTYIDYDIISLIKEFRTILAPANKIKLGILGTGQMYGGGVGLYGTASNRTVTGRILDEMSPDDVINMLKSGNIRFLRNMRLHRNLVKQVAKTAAGQYPVAAILGCIDSRTSAELIFDLGFGDVFSIRIAGNIVNDDIIGNLEFACAVSGAKLIFILGHTRCGAITAACSKAQIGYFDKSLKQIRETIAMEHNTVKGRRNCENESFLNDISRLNVNYSREIILKRSKILRDMHDKYQIKIIGGFFDVTTGVVEFLN